MLKICKELKSNLALRYQLFKYSFVHKVSILLNVLCKWSYKYKIFFQDTIYSNGCWHYLSSPRHSELLPLVSLATWKGTWVLDNNMSSMWNYSYHNFCEINQKLGSDFCYPKNLLIILFSLRLAPFVWDKSLVDEFPEIWPPLGNNLNVRNFVNF